MNILFLYPSINPNKGGDRTCNICAFQISEEPRFKLFLSWAETKK